MKKKYKIETPKFINNKYIQLFQKKSCYTYNKSEKIKPLKNVFISNSGTVLQHCMIPLNSAENLIGFQDKNFYFQRWKKALEQYLVCKYGKSLKFYTCDNNLTYYSIHTPWFGYFSWITTYLPRLLQAQKMHPESYLIYPEEWETIKYVNESLALLPNLNLKKVPIDHHILIPKFKLIPCRKWTSHFDLTELNTIRSIFYDSLKINEQSTPLKKIYISRKKAQRRKIVNENEIELILKKQDFDIICLEDFSFAEQVKLLSNSKIVIGSHGAGLTNINFMKKNTHVVELTPILSDFKKFRFPFWRMAKLLEINYYCIFCNRTNDKTDEYESDMFVNIAELESILSKLESI